jgi:hypothetical protein
LMTDSFIDGSFQFLPKGSLKYMKCTKISFTRVRILRKKFIFKEKNGLD